MPLYVTNSRGERIPEPGVGMSPDELSDDKNWCPYCGDVEVETFDETCPDCLEGQREAMHDQREQDREARRLP